MVAGPTNWKEFEQAVASFVAAIAPDARVTHDVKIPDVHTGEPRQRDVWIEWVLGGLFPTKALISCKYWATKLNEQDLDHFNGEYLSSGAKIGIIYAKAGFTPEAIRKSRVLNFHCCKLYSDGPAELPEQLCLGLAYHIAPVFRFSLTSSYASQYAVWNDVFERRLDDSTVREVVCRLMDTYQKCDSPEARWERARSGCAYHVLLTPDGARPEYIEISIRDHSHRAKLECTLVNGTYNFSASLFSGSASTPSIDTQSIDPGPGWEPIVDLPESTPSPFLVIFRGVRSDKALQHLAGQPLPRQ